MWGAFFSPTHSYKLSLESPKRDGAQAEPQFKNRGVRP